ncbi:PAS domain-containing protein [Pseudonocardia bannensis]|uniref:histidine kinase n=2 Tax=Pseudonocardia bannensis TaxID=630973 RepID=A0A848DL73_9PSEU|nr:PAS domain-containing protein [Pseudonocardia bannensis]
MLAVGNYDGYFTMVNPAFCDALGWSAGELTSLPSWAFLHPDDQHRAVEIIEQTRFDDAGVSTGHVVRMLCRNGSYRWGRWNFRSFPDAELRYWSGTTLSDADSPDPGPPVLVGTWEWDISDNVLTWSDELYRMFDLPDQLPIDYQDFLGHIHPEERHIVDAGIQRSLQSGEEFSDDFRIVHENGRIRWIRAIARLVDEAGGDAQLMFGIAVDITERRERGLP